MAIYIVFDVETPNSANNRMSAIGISAIKDNKIVANYFSLVDPETHFDSFRACVHRRFKSVMIVYDICFYFRMERIL